MSDARDVILDIIAKTEWQPWREILRRAEAGDTAWLAEWERRGKAVFLSAVATIEAQAERIRELEVKLRERAPVTATDTTAVRGGEKNCVSVEWGGRLRRPDNYNAL